jgi:hypothetical protein
MWLNGFNDNAPTFPRVGYMMETYTLKFYYLHILIRLCVIEYRALAHTWDLNNQMLLLVKLVLSFGFCSHFVD